MLVVNFRQVMGHICRSEPVIMVLRGDGEAEMLPLAWWTAWLGQQQWRMYEVEAIWQVCNLYRRAESQSWMRPIETCMSWHSACSTNTGSNAANQKLHIAEAKVQYFSIFCTLYTEFPNVFFVILHTSWLWSLFTAGQLKFISSS
jgi:hypothetical protein